MFRYAILREETEKLEMACGFCDRKIRIRSLAEHIRNEHSKDLTRN